MDLHRTAERIESSPALERPARALSDAARRLLPPGRRKDALTGTWLGHALHPLLTDFPLGMWMSGSVLDLFGGAGAAPHARRLVGLGVVAAVPTALSGVADWSDTDDGPRRLGVVHAAVNGAAWALYGASYLARRRRKGPLGVALGVAGGVVATVGGYVGGHLSLARGIGVDHTAFEDPPLDWSPVDLAAAPSEGELAWARAGAAAVMVARDRGRLYALSARCNHRGGPLPEGRLEDGCVTCPWHGSTFRVDDGSVARGPAPAPQLAYEAREVEGRVEVRLGRRGRERRRA